MAGCTHEHYPTQVAFATGQPQEGSPSTPFRQTPTKRFERKFFDARLRFPGTPTQPATEQVVWSFESETSGRGLPAPPIRCTEGDVVHATIRPSKGAHTIHWHGIEPDPGNDGVGHTSYEVTGSYTYQWQPQVGATGDPDVGSAGTYFYHCHVNTPLHVQMGMFGPLVVDPQPDPGLPATQRRAFVDGPAYDVERETLLVPYSIDPRWHRMSHSAGLSGDDAGLHRFDPAYFYLLGAELARPWRGDGVRTLTQVRARPVGSPPTLLRIVNGGYHPTVLRFTEAGGAPADIAEVFAHDGRPFRDTSDPKGPARPLTGLLDPVRRVETTPRAGLRTSRLAFGAAERFDMLLRPEAGKEYWLHVDWYHWVPQSRTSRLGSVSIPIRDA